MNNFTRAAQALSDETRLRILNLIAQKECCVCEVMQALQISQTRASRNLKILYDAGFLKMRSDGLYTLYSLVDRQDNDFHGHLLEAVTQEMQLTATAQQDRERLNKASRIGPGCAASREDQ